MWARPLIWILIGSCCLLFYCGIAFAEIEHTKDSLDTVQQNLVEKKALLVDVRTPEEWDEGHLKDAMLVPLVQLEKNPLPTDVTKSLKKDKIVYIYCRAGRRAKLAAEILAPMGYDVRPLKPGYKELRDAGFIQADAK